MEISESLSGPDRKRKQERVDIRKQAEAMVKKHEQYLKNLRETSVSGEAFREAAMQATEDFKGALKDFLTANGAEELYDELVGFVSGKVSEVVKARTENSSQD